MLDYLPAEITDNILHRLPVKTLIKCTSLSKSFLSLITSSNFISTHIALNYPTHLLLRYFSLGSEEMYHLEPDNPAFSGFQSEPFPVPFRGDSGGGWFNIAGCVNGVICLVADCVSEGTDIILWNPSIRKYVRLPESIIVRESCGAGYESVCGFGYDSISDDYKVVRVVDVGPKYKTREVEVYSLKSGCWKGLGVCPSYTVKRKDFLGYTPYKSCFLRGSVHWVGLTFSCPSYENAIIKFDIHAESFENIDVPRVLKVIGSINHVCMDISMRVQEYKGMLSLIKYEYFDGCRTCSVWVMKEYGNVESWTKIFDFSSSASDLGGMPKAFGYRENGEVIIVKDDRSMDPEYLMNHVFSYPTYLAIHHVVSIDPVTHDKRILGDEISADCRSFYMSTYVESMVLFKEGKRIDDLSEEVNLTLSLGRP